MIKVSRYVSRSKIIIRRNIYIYLYKNVQVVLNYISVLCWLAFALTTVCKRCGMESQRFLIYESSILYHSFLQPSINLQMYREISWTHFSLVRTTCFRLYLNLATVGASHMYNRFSFFPSKITLKLIDDMGRFRISTELRQYKS